MMLAEIAIGLVAMILFEFFPLQIIAAFGSESALYNEFAVMAFRIYLSTIVLCCIQKSTSIFLQSLGKPFMSTGLSLLRDFILSVPLIIILPRFFGLEGVLYSAPIADVLSMVGVVIMMLIVIKELRAQPMKLQTQER
jgi:Na+-driven multidrug efflux pump